MVVVVVVVVVVGNHTKLCQTVKYVASIEVVFSSTYHTEQLATYIKTRDKLTSQSYSELQLAV